MGCWPSSDASQLAGVLLNPADGFGNLVHIGAFTQQPGLIEPHSFLAQLVILWTLIALVPFGQCPLSVCALKSARAEGVGKELVLI